MAVFTMKSKVYIWGMHVRQNGGVFDIVGGGEAPCISEITVSTNEHPLIQILIVNSRARAPSCLCGVLVCCLCVLCVCVCVCVCVQLCVCQLCVCRLCV